MTKTGHAIYLTVIALLASLLAFNSISDRPTTRDNDLPPRLAILEFKPYNAEAEELAENLRSDLVARLTDGEEFVLVPDFELETLDAQSHHLWAANLMIDLVLEGAVNAQGDRVRISAQLIDGSSDLHLWAETYDLSLNDFSHVVDDISRQLVMATTQRKSY